ncbi:MAG: heavy metal translocating P-type ATPase [Enterococcus sp.]
MKHLKKFLSTVVIGCIALFFEFILNQPTWAYILVTIAGSLVALSMMKEMIQTLKSGRYGVDILALTAIVATLAVGQYWASLMILIMLTGGDSLEDYASRQASRELRSLLEQTPQLAHRYEQDELMDCPVASLQIGDKLLVKSGEVVPVDCQIISGTSLFDTSSLTGESLPVKKDVGEMLLSGFSNGESPVTVVATSLAKDSHYQQIIQLVKASQQNPAHFVRLADRYAVPFTIIAYLIGGIAWWVSKDPVRFAEVLVVASPCPLILAAPIALVAGMSRSSRHGIIFKTGTALEKLATVKTVAFDKTGTITSGQLKVTQITLYENYSEEQVMQYAASAEINSTHALSEAIITYAREHSIQLKRAKDIRESTGEGIYATIDAKEIKIGRASFIGKSGGSTDQIQTELAIDNTHVATISFEDDLRPEAKKTIQGLRDKGVQSIWMLTGDKEDIAQEIAKKVAITQIKAGCLPEDKLKFLQSIPEEGRPLMMVGDGINDAPALAVANVGVAMGAKGATAASESADVVILKDDLSLVSQAVGVSQDTMKVARQSVLLGIFICIFLMLWASTGYIPALVGAILQEVVDTLSILSALRAKND